MQYNQKATFWKAKNLNLNKSFIYEIKFIKVKYAFDRAIQFRLTAFGLHRDHPPV